MSGCASYCLTCSSYLYNACLSCPDSSYFLAGGICQPSASLFDSILSGLFIIMMLAFFALPVFLRFRAVPAIKAFDVCQLLSVVRYAITSNKTRHSFANFGMRGTLEFRDGWAFIEKYPLSSAFFSFEESPMDKVIRVAAVWVAFFLVFILAEIIRSRTEQTTICERLCKGMRHYVTVSLYATFIDFATIAVLEFQLYDISSFIKAYSTGIITSVLPFVNYFVLGILSAITLILGLLFIMLAYSREPARHYDQMFMYSFDIRLFKLKYDDDQAPLLESGPVFVYRLATMVFKAALVFAAARFFVPAFFGAVFLAFALAENANYFFRLGRQTATFIIVNVLNILLIAAPLMLYLGQEAAVIALEVISILLILIWGCAQIVQCWREYDMFTRPQQNIQVPELDPQVKIEPVPTPPLVDQQALRKKREEEAYLQAKWQQQKEREKKEEKKDAERLNKMGEAEMNRRVQELAAQQFIRMKEEEDRKRRRQLQDVQMQRSKIKDKVNKYKLVEDKNKNWKDRAQMLDLD